MKNVPRSGRGPWIDREARRAAGGNADALVRIFERMVPHLVEGNLDSSGIREQVASVFPSRIPSSAIPLPVAKMFAKGAGRVERWKVEDPKKQLPLVGRREYLFEHINGVARASEQIRKWCPSYHALIQAWGVQMFIDIDRPLHDLGELSKKGDVPAVVHEDGFSAEQRHQREREERECAIRRIEKYTPKSELRTIAGTVVVAHELKLGLPWAEIKMADLWDGQHIGRNHYHLPSRLNEFPEQADPYQEVQRTIDKYLDCLLEFQRVFNGEYDEREIHSKIAEYFSTFDLESEDWNRIKPLFIGAGNHEALAEIKKQALNELTAFCLYLIDLYPDEFRSEKIKARTKISEHFPNGLELYNAFFRRQAELEKLREQLRRSMRGQLSIDFSTHLNSSNCEMGSSSFEDLFAA